MMPRMVPGEEPRQHRLALLVGHVVADERQRQRHDRGRGGAGDQARRAERGERVGEARERRPSAAESRRHERDQPVLAEAVAERAPDQLAEAVGERERGGDHRGVADADVELAARSAGSAGRRRAWSRPRRRPRRSGATIGRTIEGPRIGSPGAARRRRTAASRGCKITAGDRISQAHCVAKGNHRFYAVAVPATRGPLIAAPLPGTPPNSTSPPPFPLSASRQKT